MSEIRFALSSDVHFNSQSFDRLLSSIKQRAPEPNRNLIIDFGSARFFDPSGLVCILVLARYLTQRAGPVSYVLPTDDDARAFLRSAGFVDQLSLYGEVRNTGRSSITGRKFKGLPLTLIQASTDVSTVLAHFMDVAKRELSYAPGDLADTLNVVSELGNNVKDHSQDQGLVSAQLYRDKQGVQYVQIGVADLGVGIRQSLANRYSEIAQVSHAVAIEKALSGLSSRSSGGGLGLTSIQQIIRRYNGRLSVRSGDGRIQIMSNRAPRVLSVAPFAGTQIEISFSQISRNG